jgi:diacylglycerol kinase (ATP)
LRVLWGIEVNIFGRRRYLVKTRHGEKPIIIVRNPTAGQKTGAFVRRIIAEMQARGAVVEQVFTQHAGHGVVLAANIAKSGKASLVIAAGGDGTIREVASGLYGYTTPLGIIPAGTANVLARELGYVTFAPATKRRKTARIVDILLGGNVCPVYPFTVKQGAVSHMGFCWIAAGFDAEVLVELDPKAKARLGRWAFIPAVWRALVREKKRAPISWQKGSAPQQTCHRAVIANIKRYAGPFVLTRQTDISTPGLACLQFTSRGMAARLSEQIQMLFTALDHRGKSDLLLKDTLTLGGNDSPLQLDGDFIGYGSISVTPMSGSITAKCAGLSKDN